MELDESSEEAKAFADLLAIESDPPSMRSMCLSCERPRNVCWCQFVIDKKIITKSKLLILQHPSEIRKCLRTSPILTKSLENCKIYRGKRFPGKNKELHDIFSDPNSLLLYPSSDSVAIDKLDNDISYNIIIIDGTWPQAKAMYNGSKVFKTLKKVCLDIQETSQYVIRTQPNDKCLSTVESAAILLAILEKNDSIKEKLLHPLRALCQFQLNHGAVPHDSKEFKSKNLDDS